MLRFGQPTTKSRRYSPMRERGRVWLMFAAACAVLWCIRFLQRPETVARLDSILNAGENPNGQIQQREGFEIVPVDEVTLSPAADVETDEEPDTQPARVDAVDLTAIKDNTYFRSEENTAWFALWQNLSEGQPATDTAAEVTYAQLLDQPDAYRGKLVSMRGTAMREELLDAPANDIGIDRYHRLIVQPEGGGNWPIIIYTLELPESFPRGDEIRAEISATGYFFKNWSYAWRDGLGLAPVIMAKSISWTPVITTRQPVSEIKTREVVLVVFGAAGLASLVGYFAWQQTRRMPVMPDRDIVISLPETSEADS